MNTTEKLKSALQQLIDTSCAHDHAIGREQRDAAWCAVLDARVDARALLKDLACEAEEKP